MGIRFVTAEDIRLPLSDDAYIVIKRRLTHGERDDMMARMMPYLTPGEKMQVNTRDIRTAKLAAYLVGWSAPVPIAPTVPEQDRYDTIRNLDPDTADEIEKAIDTHLEREQAALKNGRGAPSGSVPISASVG